MRYTEISTSFEILYMSEQDRHAGLFPSINYAASRAIDAYKQASVMTLDPDAPVHLQGFGVILQQDAELADAIVDLPLDDIAAISGLRKSLSVTLPEQLVSVVSFGQPAISYDERVDFLLQSFLSATRQNSEFYGIDVEPLESVLAVLDPSLNAAVRPHEYSAATAGGFAIGFAGAGPYYCREAARLMAISLSDNNTLETSGDELAVGTIRSGLEKLDEKDRKFIELRALEFSLRLRKIPPEYPHNDPLGAAYRGHLLEDIVKDLVSLDRTSPKDLV